MCHTAEIISGKWTLLIIRDLAEGRSRFCELERSLEGKALVPLIEQMRQYGREWLRNGHAQARQAA